MNVKQEYQAIVANYEKMASQLLPEAKPSTVTDDPIKLEWAKQEGFVPRYDPNSDSVTWHQTPKALYQAPELLKLQGSMSPEAASEVYPMFEIKKQQIDGLLEEIYQETLNGNITQQRAQELVIQLMKETFDGFTKAEKAASGAAGKSASLSDTISNLSKAKKIAGANQ
jgi:hypothetical protein